jgi:hypothetical protein
LLQGREREQRRGRQQLVARHGLAHDAEFYALPCLQRERGRAPRMGQNRFECTSTAAWLSRAHSLTDNALAAAPDLIRPPHQARLRAAQAQAVSAGAARAYVIYGGVFAPAPDRRNVRLTDSTRG